MAGLFEEGLFEDGLFEDGLFESDAEVNCSYSLYANPAANPLITTAATYAADDAGFEAAYERVVDAGIDHSWHILSWEDLESEVGVYDLGYVDRWVDNTASLPLWFTWEVIRPGGAISVPSDLGTTDFSNAAAISAGEDFLNELFDATGSRLTALTIGNEIHDYLNADAATRVPQFVTFLTAMSAHAKTLWGSEFEVSTCFNYPASLGGVWVTNDYDSIKAVVDITAWTVYPINYSTFAFKDFTDGVDGLGTWLGNILGAVSGSPIIIQETQCPSASTIGSSESLQSLYYDIWFTIIMSPDAFGPFIQKVNFVWLSDLSSAILDNIGLTPGNQRDFVGSLGLRTTSNTPKQGFPTLVMYLNGVTGDTSTARTLLLLGV